MAKISQTKPTLSEVKADLAARAQAYCDRTEEYCGTLNLENLNIHESPIGQDIPVYTSMRLKHECRQDVT
ncbi:MAG: hypothetical protein WDM70_09935 [Nitrosomonadales bacterium]